MSGPLPCDLQCRGRALPRGRCCIRCRSARSCTLQPHQAYDPWPRSLRRSCSCSGCTFHRHSSRSPCRLVPLPHVPQCHGQEPLQVPYRRRYTSARSCTLQPHRAYDPWPRSLRRSCSRSGCKSHRHSSRSLCMSGPLPCDLQCRGQEPLQVPYRRRYTSARSCTLQPHRAYDPWPRSLRRLCSRNGCTSHRHSSRSPCRLVPMHCAPRGHARVQKL